MSFGQVFIAGEVSGEPARIGPGRWQLFVNGRAVAELEAVGEQLLKGSRTTQRVIAYQGQIDTRAIDLPRDEVTLVRVADGRPSAPTG